VLKARADGTKATEIGIEVFAQRPPPLKREN
jgi:hypothetical protein